MADAKDVSFVWCGTDARVVHLRSAGLMQGRQCNVVRADARVGVCDV